MRSRLIRLVGVVGAVSVVVGASLAVTPAPAVAQPPSPKTQQFAHPALRTPPAKPVTHYQEAAKPWQAPPVAWPTAGSAIVDLAADPTSSFTPEVGAQKVRAAELPVWVGRPAGVSRRRGTRSRVKVTLSDRDASKAAGVTGLLVSAEAVDATGAGPVTVSMDLSSIAGEYGADWLGRARLVRLPACALTTPTVPSCQVQTPVATSRDARTRTLTATVALDALTATSAQGAVAGVDSAAGSSGMLVLAATAGASGNAGDFGATSLTPSGSWSAGGNSGGFSYSYPILGPPVPAGSGPSVALSYSSQAVDGKMVSTNSQSSWIGDGWDYTPGFVEQTYVNCKDNPQGTAKNTDDACWAGQILHVSFGSTSADMVYDATLPTKWKLSNDNGEKVEQVRTLGINGTFDGLYWKITTQDGMQFYFGRNQLPGWVSGKAVTNSAWTEPVYSPYSGDPCYAKTNHLCTMAYRWNLDYVVDTHHNATGYFYNAYTNYYGQNGGTTGVSYIRSGELDHVDYGMVDPTPYAASAPARIKFNTSERCVATGTACNAGNITTTPSNWPDTPYADLNCNSGAVCNVHSPTFWSRLRLTSIVTNVWNGTAYSPVDTYALTQTFPASQDSTSPSLWLSTITRTGNVGGNMTMLPVTFTGSNMPNRVDTADFAPAMNHQRLTQIVTETGGKIGIGYTGQQCTAPVTINPATNTSLCYPVYWTPPGQTQQKLDWFNKYLVTSVGEEDPTGYGPPKATEYQYVGTPAWHIDDNELTKAKYRTYGQWRGYAVVRTRTGSAQKTLTESRFFRGMGGTVTLSPDVPWPSGGPAASVTDSEELAGGVRETVTYLGDGGVPISASATDQWVSAAHATRARTGVPDLTATFRRGVVGYATTAITSSTPTTWRTTKTETTYDTSTGLPTVVFNHGDLAVPSQATCTTVGYAPANTSLNLVSLPADMEKDAKACGGSGVNGLTAPTSLNRPADVISKVRTYYNDPTFDTTWPQPSAPANNDVTMLRTAYDYTGGAFQYRTSTRNGYDSFGRVTSTTDAIGNPPTTTTYTQTNGLTTQIKSTNARGRFSIDTLDPTRGVVTKAVDANNLEVDLAYDQLGRRTAEWLPGNNTTTNPANIVFQYDISNTVPSAITTKMMNDNGSYRVSVALFDALTRPRQVQSQSPTGGRLVDDTFYDSHGWVVKAIHQYHDASAPSSTLVDLRGQDNLMLNENLVTYDGVGRVVLDKSQRAGVAKWQTQTVYEGDRTTLLGPPGSTPVTAIKDALGRQVELRSYTAAPSVVGGQVTGGSFTKLTYGYDLRGNQSSVTDGATPANTWTSTFNLLGQVTDKTDPDTGATHLTYDANGNLQSSKDARNKTIFHTYDDLNRPTNVYDGPNTSSPLLASWSYDSTTITNGLGQLASSTSYDNGYAYTTTVGGYTNRYQAKSVTVGIPADPRNGTLAGSYLFTNTYSLNNELLTKVAYPVTTGALPAETVNFGYNVLDLPTSTSSLLGAYINTTLYNDYGLVSQVQMNTGTNASYLTPMYDDHDLRLASTHVERTGGIHVDDVTYRTLPAGTVTAIVDKRNDTITETQCFDHDLLGRLTAAWTANDDCAADVAVTGSNATVGGIDPYWTSWTFNDRGDRSQEVQHALTGQSGGDTTSTYNYPTSGGTQPHALTSVTVQGPNGSPSGYTYDLAGNLATRTTTANGAQTMTFNSLGKLAAVDKNSGAATSTYTYDAGGNILVQRGPGTVTVYLPGEELTLNTLSGVTTGKRYYSGAGVTAVRTGTTSTAFSYLINNNQGTATLSTDRTGQNPSWKPFTPYGGPRGTQPGLWPDTHGFLGQPTDSTTGLNIIGARQYDPTTGRFISPDPVFEATDTNQLGGYSYAGNSPISHSDPTGLCAAHNDPGTPCGDGHMHDPKPTTDDTTTQVKVTCDTTCQLKRSAGVTPDQLNFMRLHGYTGPNDPTYADVMNWSASALVHWRYACQNIFGGTADQCKQPPGYKAPTGGDYVWAAVEGANNTITIALLPIFCIEEGMCSVTLEQKSEVLTAEATMELEALIAEDSLIAEEVLGESLVHCNSFDPDTRVLMGDGTSKPIKEVKVGDVVLSTDPVTGQTRSERVTRLHVNQDAALTDLTVVIDGHVKAVIHTTTHHLFWNESGQHWSAAGRLRPGDSLKTADGHVAKVAGVHTWTGQREMRNLTVDLLHTYYVLAGETPILVHNDDSLVTVGRWMSTAEYDAMVKTGMVQRGGGGFSYVVYPANRDAYISSRPGSVYVEFDVPKSTLIDGGRPGDYKISDSDTIFSRLSVKRGGPELRLPEAKNIKIVGAGGVVC
ncbi:TreTu family toxin [Catellatospora tritici]|uniref:TreTu family toxin n=1 Tax=Catellatospora tritici TaxID=2851566 RepID=UPI001C2DE12F|nr:RHS repeat-associated core domain-containing protein [Catellatospora tritici]MBV1856079.1 sugar-binding protein [Catellatospora tritici]